MRVCELLEHMIPDDRVNITITGCDDDNRLEVLAESENVIDKTDEYDKREVMFWSLRAHTLQIIVKK